MYLTSLLWTRENANDSMGSDFIHLFAWKEPSVGDLYLIQLPLSIKLPLLLISSTWESHTCSLMQTPPCVLSNTLFITWVGWRKCPRQYLQHKGPLHNHQVIQWMSHLACPYQVVAGISPCFSLVKCPIRVIDVPCMSVLPATLMLSTVAVENTPCLQFVGTTTPSSLNLHDTTACADKVKVCYFDDLALS